MEVEEIFYLLKKQKDIIKIKRLEKLENWINIIKIHFSKDIKKVYEQFYKEFSELKGIDSVPKTAQQQKQAVEKLRNFLK